MVELRARPTLGGFQRSRLLARALDEASRCGYANASVGAIVARARVSRETFHEIFAGREDRGAANAWRLAPRGRQLASAIVRDLAGHSAIRPGERDA